MTEQNWAGTYRFTSGAIHRPTTIDALIAVLRDAEHVRALGTRHSFTDIADSEVLVDLSQLPGDLVFDADASTVRVPASRTYADVAQFLRPHGMALHNMASLPHISVAGAVATATHGSGVRNGNLATSVVGLEFVNTAGELVVVDRSTPDFEGMVVSLGGLGIVAAVTLDVVFDYEIEQTVFDDVALDLVIELLDEVLATAYSVSVFTRFGSAYDSGTAQVWIKRRADGRDRSVRQGATFLGARAADAERHPIPGMAAESCTRQLGVAGPWADRLPHFRMGYTPSAGDEAQSEFFVATGDARQALDAVRARAAEFADALLISEIRAVAADELWMSPQYGRDSVAVHFTWRNDADLVDRAVTVVEEALAPFAPRPHWGKVFHADRFAPAEAYECFDDFIDLAERLDPHGVFRNDWWHRTLGV